MVCILGLLKVDFLVANLNPDYIGVFLEDVDGYVIPKINHGLDTDFCHFIEIDSHLSNIDVLELYANTSDLSKIISAEINEVENKIYEIDSRVPSLGICCEEMRGILNQIDESLFVINGQVKVVESEPINA